MAPPKKPQSPPAPSKADAPSSPEAPSKPTAPSSPACAKKGKRIEVNLATQEAVLYEDCKELKRMKLSSGRPGNETPRGSFTIEKRDKDHKSSTYGFCVQKDGSREPIVRKGGRDCPKGSRYEGAPMPYYQKLTGHPLGFHQGSLPGYPASHGCIRLSSSDAEHLWKWAKEGTPVKIDGKTPSRRPKGKPKGRPKAGRGSGRR